MKGILILHACFMIFFIHLSFYAEKQVLISARAISNAGSISYVDVKISMPGLNYARTVPLRIVNLNGEKALRMVWILHGYKPAGDPYMQDPDIIIRKWGLPGISRRLHAVFFLPDMGTTVYPMSDIEDIYQIFLYYKELIAPEGVILTGISTGSEGAVKFASLCGSKVCLVCISGTFDLAGLNQSAGEFRIHEKVFKTPQDWKNENPLEILRNMKGNKVYVFSEENSIFHGQAVNLIKTGLTNIDIIDRTALGKGFSHNWDFWKSPALYSNLLLIFNRPISP